MINYPSSSLTPLLIYYLPFKVKLLRSVLPFLSEIAQLNIPNNGPSRMCLYLMVPLLMSMKFPLFMNPELVLAGTHILLFFTGVPVISDLQYNSSVPALICYSTGQIVPNVTWYRDCVPVSTSSGFIKRGNLVDISRGTIKYMHILEGPLLGTFTYAISDKNGRTDLRSFTLNGRQ